MSVEKLKIITVGDDTEEVVIRKGNDGHVLLVVGDQWMDGVSLGLLRSLHQAAGAYLALTK